MDIFETDFKAGIVTQLSKLIEKDEKGIQDFIFDQIRSSVGDRKKKKDFEDFDYSFNLMTLRRYSCLKKGTEKTTATSWADQIEVGNDGLVAVKADSNGVLYFMIDKSTVMSLIMDEVIALRDKYGTNLVGSGRKVLVEFSSPNIAKPFHMGHLRSTMIGNFIANLHQMLNYEVIRINYLGDWGKQFGLLGVGFREMIGGNHEEELENDPMKFLFKIYVAVNKALELEEEKLGTKQTPLNARAQNFFRLMEENVGENASDSPELQLWEKLRNISIGELEKMYSRLGIKFDLYSGESQVNVEYLPRIIQTLKESNLLVADDHNVDKSENEKSSDEQDQLGSNGADETTTLGARFVNLEEQNLGKAMILKSDGSSLYLTRDLAEAERRSEMFGSEVEKSFYVVGDAQSYHFKQLFQIQKLIKSPMSGKGVHIGFGKVLEMSTRKGKAVFLSDFLDTARDKMFGVMQEGDQEKFNQMDDPSTIADQLGISALVVWDFNRRRSDNYSYDWKIMTSFKGETGPYLQYAHARICNIIRKVVPSQIDIDQALVNKDYKLLVEPEAYALVRIIGMYPKIVIKCSQDLEPGHMIGYLMNLAKAISVVYRVVQVKDVEDQLLAETRFCLYWVAGQVLASGLRLIGLTPIESM